MEEERKWKRAGRGAWVESSRHFFLSL